MPSPPPPQTLNISQPPPAQTITPSPQPTAVLPEIKSLETKPLASASASARPTPDHWQALQDSWQAAPAQPPSPASPLSSPVVSNPPTVIGTPPLHPSLLTPSPSTLDLSSPPAPELSSPTPTIAPTPVSVPTPLSSPSYLSTSPPIPTPLADSLSGSSGGPSRLSFLSRRPILAGLSFVALVALIAGAFALPSLLHKNQPGSSSTTNLSSQTNNNTFLSTNNTKLTINLDTVIAKGKSLTLGQLIADPTTNVLQLAGDFTASGTLAASGGSTFANNSGLVIDKVTVCTSAGCIPNVNIPTIAGSSGTASGQAGAVALLNANNQTFTGANRFGTNSTSAFQIQNANNTSNLLVANTLNSRIGIATATPAFTLDVNGDINSSTGVRVNGALLCNAAGCTAAGGSNNYIQNSTALQSANFNVQSASTTSVTGTIRAKTDQTADLLDLKDQAGVNVVSIGSTGNTLIQPSTNSINAFLVYNANATSHLIGGDTLNARVAIAKPTPPDYTLDVGGDINTTTGLRVAGNLVCSTVCTPGGGSGSYIQNGTALQSANYAIQSDLNSHVAALIRGASGQSADMLRLVAGDASVNLLSVGGTGATKLQNSIDSTTAFQVQNAGGTSNLFVADTSNTRLGVGATPANSLLTIGTNTIVASGGVTFGTDTNLYRYFTAASGAGLATDGAIFANGGVLANGSLFRSTRSGNTGSSFQANITGDLGYRLNVYADGKMYWGDGTTVQGDTNLSRSGVNTLLTNASFNIQTATNSTTAFQVQNAGSNNYIQVDTSGANLYLGNTGIASTIQIGNTTGAVAQTVNIGNNATASGTSAVTIGNLLGTSATTIQGGTGASAIGLSAGTSGTISVGTTNVNTVTVGSIANTGTLTFGQSTAGETINIGNGNVATGNTNTISIGATATSTGKDVVTIGSTVAASTLTLQGGNTSSAVSIQSAASGTVSLGSSGVANTIQIGNTTGAVAQTINIGNNATGASATTVVLGSSIGTSPVTLQAGSSGINLLSSSGNIVIGTSDTTATLLVLDTKTTAGDPTCTSGGLYYNSNSTTIRACLASAWDDLIPAAGWNGAGETWTWTATDGPTFTFTVPSDVTTKYTPGQRLKLTQTTVKYFIITAVSTFSGGVTTITAYGGTDYIVSSGSPAISANFYSSVKAPFGFPLDPVKWTVTTVDTADQTQATAVQSTWYNLGSVTISLPIGAWSVEYEVAMSNSGSSRTMQSTLSTANNSESDTHWTVSWFAGTATSSRMTAMRRKPITVVAKTSYYLNINTPDTGTPTLNTFGSNSPTIIRAVCAYL